MHGRICFCVVTRQRERSTDASDEKEAVIYYKHGVPIGPPFTEVDYARRATSENSIWLDFVLFRSRRTPLWRLVPTSFWDHLSRLDD